MGRSRLNPLQTVLDGLFCSSNGRGRGAQGRQPRIDSDAATLMGLSIPNILADAF